MCEEEPQQQELSVPIGEPEPEPEVRRTSDYYRVREDLPEKFNYPSCFRGYGTTNVHPLYKTNNQTYGSRPPTVHEMPTAFNSRSNAFSKRLAKTGMYRNNGLNTGFETSYVTGTDNNITFYDRHNFHKSYNVSGPSDTG